MPTGARPLVVIANLLLAAVTNGSSLNDNHGSTVISSTRVASLLVEILSTEHPLSVGQETEISCRSIGVHLTPPANISWWLDGEQIVATNAQKYSADGNKSICVLRWTPSIEDDGRKLTCKASHIELEDSAIETSIHLNLHYVPRVVSRLGPPLKPNDIKEGDDIYFECIVRANPPASKVLWKHNDDIVIHNPRAGVVITSAYLVLQGVSRQQAGSYRCSATNDEGDGISEPVMLQIISNNSQSHQNSSSRTPSAQNRRSGLELAAVMESGTHVVRGDDWTWGNQDGGAGSVGTITSISPRGRVMVKWGDDEHEYMYRTGEDGKYELKLAPSAPVQTGATTKIGNEKSSSNIKVAETSTQSKLQSSNELFGKLVKRELEKVPEKKRLKLMEEIIALFRNVNAVM